MQEPHALGHAIYFAAVATQQVVAQVKAVLHHLELNSVSGFGDLEGVGGGGFGAMLAVDSSDVHKEQHQHHQQNQAEIQVKFLANRHCHSSFCQPRCTIAGSSVLRRELDFHHAGALRRSCFESPLLDCIHSGTNQNRMRSEEHTSELQSPYDLVCRLL